MPMAKVSRAQQCSSTAVSCVDLVSSEVSGVQCGGFGGFGLGGGGVKREGTLEGHVLMLGAGWGLQDKPCKTTIPLSSLCCAGQQKVDGCREASCWVGGAGVVCFEVEDSRGVD